MAGKHIELAGFKQWSEIKRLVGKARFSVIPSEWYENNPLSVIEAQCLGTPVLGARIGGIPELISEETGMTFESRNTADLKKKLKRCTVGLSTILRLLSLHISVIMRKGIIMK